MNLSVTADISIGPSQKIRNSFLILFTKLSVFTVKYREQDKYIKKR